MNNYDSGYGIWLGESGATNPAPTGTMVQVLGGPDANHLSAVTNTVGVVSSRSRRGNGYDNAARESFWSALKRARIHRRHFATRSEARTAVFEGSAVFYNRVRLPSALGFPSPVDLEANLN